MPDASCLVPGAADNADADAVKVVKYVKLSKQCSWWTLAFEVHMWASCEALTLSNMSDLS